MHRFLGLTEPLPKKQKTDIEKREISKKYESARERTFQSSWLKQYPWLKLNDEKKMICKVCCLYDKIGPYVVGCGNFRVETIKKHEQSKGHNDNALKEKAKSHKTLNDSVAGKSILSLNKSVFDRLCKLFRNAHTVAKLGRPYTDYVAYCQLDLAKNTNIGLTYHTDKACQKFITAIADECRQKQNEFFDKAPFFALISDGSTDTSSQEAEILYARASYNGTVKTHFIGVKDVAKADADNISRALGSLLHGRFGGSWKQKLTSMGTDGASVMLGRKSGVIQRLGQEIGRPIFAIHCSAHRLELAYKDATKTINVYKTCELLLSNIYLFYKYSSLNRANLKSSSASIGKEVLIPTRVGGTRWLPHTKKAIEHLLHGHGAIVQHLEQMQSPDSARKESSAKARSFLRALKDPRIKMWLSFMLDVVRPLSEVTNVIQSQNSTVFDVWVELEAAKQNLCKLKNSDGPSLRQCIKEMSACEEITLGAGRQQVIESLIAAINTRFHSDLHLFKTSAILNFRQWPEVDDEGFGEEAITELISTTGEALRTASTDLDSIETEWTRLKTKLYESKVKIKKQSWPDVCDTYGEDCPNLFKLIDYLLTLPSCSVDAERGFSSMKFIKNDWRSRLCDQNLSDLIMVFRESPSIQEFDPTEAVNLWFTKGDRSRRPNYMKDIMNCTEDEKSGSGSESEVEELGVDSHQEIPADEPQPYIEEMEDLRDIIELQRKQYQLFCDSMN